MEGRCPYCGKAVGAVKNHIRLTGGGGHGPRGRYPDGFAPTPGELSKAAAGAGTLLEVVEPLEPDRQSAPPGDRHARTASPQKADVEWVADLESALDSDGGARTPGAGRDPASTDATAIEWASTVESLIDAAGATERRPEDDRQASDGSLADLVHDVEQPGPCPRCGRSMIEPGAGEEFVLNETRGWVFKRHERRTTTESDRICPSCDLLVDAAGGVHLGRDYPDGD